MTETTKSRLISSATSLLDGGGQNAVTLRAVAEQVGVSHNAPYRHFRDRNALLSAVAERDFDQLKQAFEARNRDNHQAGAALRAAAAALIQYAADHPARYRLLFSDLGLYPEQSLKDAAAGSFVAFGQIVARCQDEGLLPKIATVSLTGLIYASLHGAIDLDLGGRASGAKGLGRVEATTGLLFDLLGQVGVKAR